MIITKEYALKIFNGELPGLFALNHKGCYGEYKRLEVIFAENCELFGFVIYKNEDDPTEDIKFPTYEGVDKDEVLLYKCVINVTAEYKLKAA